MSNVVVKTSQSLGPLNLQLFRPGGQAASSRVLLSSTKSSATFAGIPPGDYVLVATRPGGEEMIQEVRVAQTDQDVTVMPPTGQRSPSEFLAEAAWRGLVPTVADSTPRDAPLSSSILPATAPSSFTLQAIHSSRQRVRTRALVKDQELGIHIWSQRSTSSPPRYKWNRSPDYLQLAFDPAPADEVHAIGVLDPRGIGPIVIVPSFAGGLDLAFIARGVASICSAKRVSNPSAVRVPVAIATPRDPRLADLLAALAAPVMPGASDLWVSGGDPNQSRAALEVLLEKGRDPIGAIIAGLFLARFKPKTAPLEWLRRLADITAPFAADGLILLARHLIRFGDSKICSPRDEIERLLYDAAKSWCLFGSSRAQLVQSRQLLGLAAAPGGAETASPDPGTYLDLAADAGGLEAFWGGGPESPGRALRDGVPPKFLQDHIARYSLPFRQRKASDVTERQIATRMRDTERVKVLPDILAFLQKETELTRHTFADEPSRQLNEQLHASARWKNSLPAISIAMRMQDRNAYRRL